MLFDVFCCALRCADISNKVKLPLFNVFIDFLGLLYDGSIFYV
jgi:hypothetical protein